MESPERGRLVAGIALEFPLSDEGLSCSPPTVPTWLRKRLSEPKTPPPSTVEEIEAKLRDAELRRQKFHEHLTIKARLKPRSPSRTSSNEDDLGQRLEAKLQAAEEKRLSILASSQMRLAKLDELRQAAKSQVELRFKEERAELGTKVEMRVRKAEANRLLILKAHRQRRANLKERISQSLMRRLARECKYKERVHAAISQKRANAEKKRQGLLDAEKRRARARVLQVQKVAKSVSYKRELERSEMKNKLEDRLQRARKKRAEYLMQRGRAYSAAHSSWEVMHEQGDILARKLARCWIEFRKRRKTTAHLARAYDDLNINERSVKSMPFEQFAVLIQSTNVLQTTKALLDRLEIRYKLSRCTPNTSGWDDIDHLLKRVASPKRKQIATPRRKQTPRKISSGEDKKSVSGEQSARTSVNLSRYQVRVVLCAYMILGHPDAVISGQGEREAVLVKSAVKFVKEFELIIKILLNGPLQISDGESDILLSRRTFMLQLTEFDSAWCSFLNSFVVWKAKDAKSLEEDLVRAACCLELSMIQKCKMTADGDSVHLSHDMKAIQKQVSEDQKLLREKVFHLSGDAGIERMENALYDTRMKHFSAKENGRQITTSVQAQSLAPSSSVGSSDKASSLTVGSKKQSSVVRTVFKDDINCNEVTSPMLSHGVTGSSEGSLIVENERIVNEYVHGEQLAFVDSSSSEHQSGIMAKVKVTMERAFWDGIIESAQQVEPDYSRVVELMREARDGICSMAPRSWRQDITEAIDLEILTQVLNAGKLDLSYLGKILEYALVTLQKLSAPACEDELRKKHREFMNYLAKTCCASEISENSHVIALIKGIRFLLEQMQELKWEISKAQIKLLEPFLKGPDALYFLGKTFTGRYGHPSSAASALPLTEKWLSSVREGKDEDWSEHKSLLSELAKGRDSSSTFLPSTTLRTGGTSLVKISADTSSASSATGYIETIDPCLECKGEEIDLLVRLGLLKLVRKIAGLTDDELPETMKLNLSRLRSVQSQIQKIIVIATSLLVLRQILLSQRMVSSQAQMDNILMGSVRQLSKCLNSVADAGIPEIIEALSSAVEEENKLMMLNPMKEIMARMLSKSLQGDDPIFTRVSQAVYLASRGVVLGGTGKQGRELAEMELQKVGASLLLDVVVQTASVLVTTVKVSVIVHGPWYANLIRSFL